MSSILLDSRSPARADSAFAVLPTQQRLALELALSGLTNKAIAVRLGVSLRTVERLRSAALRRLGVGTLVEAARLAEPTSSPARPLLGAAAVGAEAGFAVVAPSGRLIATNAAYCRLLGRSEEELTGTPFAELTHPDDVAENVAQARRIFSGESTAFRLRKRYLRPDGEVVAAELSVVRSVGADGVPLAVGVSVPITDSPRAAPAVTGL